MVLGDLLLEMGFAPGLVVESILTTVSGEGEANAAPMGVWVKDGKTRGGRMPLLVLRPFPGTRTARNLSEVGEAVINLTWDPRVFFYTAFKGLRMDAGTGEGRTSGVGAAGRCHPVYVPSRVVRAPRLEGMLGYVEVEAKEEEWDDPYGRSGGSGRLCFGCRVRFVEAPLRRPAAYSRACFAAIECVIHATRVQALYASNLEEAKRLTGLIREYHRLVERIAPESEYTEVTKATLKLASRWMEERGEAAPKNRGVD